MGDHPAGNCTPIEEISQSLYGTEEIALAEIDAVLA
jgi:hypothetical protein